MNEYEDRKALIKEIMQNSTHLLGTIAGTDIFARNANPKDWTAAWDEVLCLWSDCIDEASEVQ